MGIITGFLSVPYASSISASTIGDIDLNELAQLQQLEFLKGPKGDQGGPGPQGPQGPPGPDKTLNVTTVSKTETLQGEPGNGNPFIGSSIVECPAGTEVTGGGYEFNESEEDSSKHVTIFENMPFNNGWKATAKVTGTNSIELTVYAKCSQLSDST